MAVVTGSQCKVGCTQPLNLTLGYPFISLPIEVTKSLTPFSYVILILIVKFPIHLHIGYMTLSNISTVAVTGLLVF